MRAAGAARPTQWPSSAPQAVSIHDAGLRQSTSVHMAMQSSGPPPYLSLSPFASMYEVMQ